MITSILKRETCAKCLICCHYTENDKWDAPGFTKEEFEYNSIGEEYNFYCLNNLFYLEMEKINNEYICPFLSASGCKLDTKKPFKCAIWPLYVVKKGDKIALAVSDVCADVYKLSNEDIINGIKYILPDIKKMVQSNPELIEQYRDNFRFLFYLEI